MRIAVTGATGHLGRHTISSLMDRGVAAADIVAIVRNEDKAADLAAQGVTVALAPFEDEAALTSAFQGVDRLVMISAPEIGRRVHQHANIINAAKAAGISLIAYTSVLHAGTSTISLAAEHRETEALLAASGIDTVLLRNGWYWENYASFLDTAKATGHVFGAAANGKLGAAARKDYAEAAATVITSDGHAGKTYELVGHPALTYPELAAVVGQLIGQDVSYVDQSEADYVETLKSAGLPQVVAELIAGWDVAVANDQLADPSRDLQNLIGRESTSAVDALAA